MPASPPPVIINFRLHPAFSCFAALVLTAASGRAQDFDLSALSPYNASAPKTHGVVRIHDTELTEHLVHLWQDHFLKLHPLVRYAEYTVPAWFSGLCAGTADLAVTGHDAWRSDLKAFESIYGYPPLEIMIATGGFNLRKGNTPGLIVFVNKDNPLAGLTVEQLDGIFGAERSGLTNEELNSAHALLRIPANPAYAALNLAMAVQIVSYEILCARSAGAQPGAPRAEPLATPQEMERLYAHLATVLEQIDFRDRTQRGTHLMNRIRRLLQRAELDSNEANILRGILTAVQQQRRRAGERA